MPNPREVLPARGPDLRRNIKRIIGMPVETWNFTYSGGRLDTVTVGNEVLTLTYNADNTVQKVNVQTESKDVEFNYTAGGDLDTIDVNAVDAV
jgi:hypothetical protein